MCVCLSSVVSTRAMASRTEGACLPLPQHARERGTDVMGWACMSITPQAQPLARAHMAIVSPLLIASFPRHGAPLSLAHVSCMRKTLSMSAQRRVMTMEDNCSTAKALPVCSHVVIGRLSPITDVSRLMRAIAPLMVWRESMRQVICPVVSSVTRTTARAPVEREKLPSIRHPHINASIETSVSKITVSHRQHRGEKPLATSVC